MTTFETEELSQRRAAVIAGLATLAMAGCAAFAVGFVNGALLVKGDADATAGNITRSLALFRSGIFAWLVILVCDILVSFALYSFLKQADSSLALLGAWFRLIYCAILGVALLNLVYVLLIAGGDGALAAAGVNAQVMLYVEAFDKMWSFGLIVFGLHLLVIGKLVLKSGFIPGILGLLLLVAAAGYIIVHSLDMFFPQAQAVTAILENILSLPMALGELAFGVWLLLKGGKVPKAAA